MTYLRTLILLLILTAAIPRSSFADTRAGLIGWWKLDEPTGTTSFDSSWSGFNGTWTNTPTFQSNCPRSGCLRFVGASSQYVDISGLTSSSSFIGASNVTFTVSAWFNTLDTTSAVIVAKQNSSTGGWSLNFNGSTQAINAVYKDGSGTNSLQRTTSSSALNDGKWHHIVVTFTANTTSSTGQDIQIYIDGASNQFGLTNSGATACPTVSVEIGARNGVSTLPITGMIDDVRIYNRAITAQEIKDLYNPGIRLNYAPGT